MGNIEWRIFCELKKTRILLDYWSYYIFSYAIRGFKDPYLL